MTGPRPIVLPDLNVSGHLPNAIELAFRQMSMSPAERKASQEAFQARREAFAHDFPRALPSGVPAMAGTALTDVASLDLPGLPPALPAVRARGDELTDRLTQYLQHLFGAPTGTEGTQAGTEVGSIAAGSVLPEAIGSLWERLSPLLRSPVLEDPGMLRPGEARRWAPGKEYQIPERFTNHDLAGNAYMTSGRVIREPWDAPIVPQYVPPRVPMTSEQIWQKVRGAPTAPPAPAEYSPFAPAPDYARHGYDRKTGLLTPYVGAREVHPWDVERMRLQNERLRNAAAPAP